MTLSMVAPPAAAQETRAAELARAQAEKARATRPYGPGRIERTITRLTQKGFFTLPQGLYPFVGSVMAGGGLALGPAVRRPFGETGSLSGYAAWSIRNYKALDARLLAPAVAAGRIRLEAHGRWLDAPSVAFYGVGNDTRRGARSTFLLRPTTVGATASVTPIPSLRLGGGVDYLDIETGRGRREVSATDRFAAADAPGLGASPSFTVPRAFAELDTRQSPGYTTSGALVRVDVASYRQRDVSAFSFRRLDAESNVFIPILRANWVIALRALASFTDADAGSDVPFFLMPSLGGGSELRGFRSFRFRDRHRMLFTGEYRWTPSRFLDMALFYETGAVAARRGDLSSATLHPSYGFGMRFHAPQATVLRFELARGREGTRFIVGSGPVF
jgi:hypothetical protein